MLRVECDEVALVLAAIDAHLLDPLEGDNRDALSAAAGKVLASFSAGDMSRHDDAIRDKVKLGLALRALRGRKRSSSHD